MRALDQILTRFPMPTWQPLAWVTMVMLAGTAAWASMTELDRVAVALGSVVPQGEVRVVQHLEGGIVMAIHVREGDEVVAGQPLIQLDLGSGGLNAEEIQVRLDGLELERSRLLSEYASLDLSLPGEPSRRQPQLAEAEKAAFLSRRREHQSNLLVLREQKKQKELEVQSIQSRITSVSKNLELSRAQYDMAARLGEQSLVPEMQVLEQAREVEQLEGELATLRIAKPAAEMAFLEAEERLVHERHRFHMDAAERLREVELEMARQSELFERANSQVHRAEIVSPIDGVVQDMKINTIGGVVGPAEPIVEIVPSNERLVVEAQLSPLDIGHVAVGQPATVKITTYDFLTYGTLEGRIVNLSADTNQDADGNHYFRMIVETDSDRLLVGNESYPISPGMQAQVDVELGQRSVLQYIVEPVLKLRNEAFRDR